LTTDMDVTNFEIHENKPLHGRFSFIVVGIAIDNRYGCHKL
jgi:hypothetical protein